MPMSAVFGEPVVVVVDVMDFRRALVARFLKDWAAAEKVQILSFAPDEAHQALREAIDCRMIIFNAGAALCSSADTLTEIEVMRVLAPSAALVFLADKEIPEEVVSVMRSGAEGYLSNGFSPDLVLRALSFVLNGGTYFPRSAIAHLPFPNELSLKGKAEVQSEVTSYEILGTEPIPASTAGALPSSQPSEFSARQKAILERLCHGEPNKTIGRALNLPESTVKVHVRLIMRKLSVTNRTQVALVAARMPSASTVTLDSHDRFGGDESPAAGRGVHSSAICPLGSADSEKMRPVGAKANGGSHKWISNS